MGLPFYLSRGKQVYCGAGAWSKADAYTGGALMFCFVLFLLSNGLCYLLPTPPTIAAYGPLRLLSLGEFSSVPLSSSVFFAGLGAWAFAYRASPYRGEVPAQKDPTDQGESPEVVFTSFSRGLLIASVLLLCYGLVQHLSGFDYRYPHWQLPLGERFKSGNYRVVGFYGHPLSLAGVSLGIFTCYWFLFSSALTADFSAKKMLGLIKAPGLARYYFAIALVHFFLIILSGGRAPLCVAAGMLLVVPLLSGGWQQGFSLRERSGLFGLLLALLGSVFLVKGVRGRFVELAVEVLSGQADRFKFWRIYGAMIVDRPWFGHGSAYIKYLSRDLYYHELGFATLVDKYNAHNIYLELLASVGIIGFVALSLSVAYLLWQMRPPFTQGIAPLLWKGNILALGANCLFGCSQNIFFDANVIYVHLAFFWLLRWLILLPKT